MPTPLLLAIAGPARGRAVPIDRPISIGRGEQSAVVIADLALSRRHCELEPTPDGIVLRDLASRNGSWVNGVPITQHVMAAGDRIRIGDSMFLFVRPDAGAALAESDVPPVRFDDTPLASASTVAVAARDTIYGRVADSRVDPIDTSRAARDLAALLQVSDALQRTTSRQDFHALLLARALDVVPADAAAILSADSATGELAVAFIDRRSDVAVTISRSIASRALADRAAMLVNEVATEAAPSVAIGATGTPVRAALCVPVLTTDDPRCALYLMRRAGGSGFADGDLQVLAGIGSIGGLALDRLRHLEWLESENGRLRTDEAIDHQMIGESAALQAVFRFVARAAPTEATVLLRGESGTGKELVAHAIHANSPRVRGPFIAINCAALPEPLLESELFGHERGAFTGAVAQQRGRMELANGGTLFLDEIGELAPALQAKLLRVLQERTVERIGGRRAVPIDVRIIAATNRDLDAAIVSGEFRRDLYYRLDVVSLVIPPLRERREDIPLLAAYFARKHAARCKRRVRGISADVRKTLMHYDWPGNVRELENAIERAVVLGTTDVLHADDLPESLLEHAQAEPLDTGFHARVVAHKRAVIEDAMHRTGGNVAAAARALGLQPTYLHRLIRNLRIGTDE